MNLFAWFTYTMSQAQTSAVYTKSCINQIPHTIGLSIVSTLAFCQQTFQQIQLILR